jgi:hypothetical protein
MILATTGKLVNEGTTLLHRGSTEDAKRRKVAALPGSAAWQKLALPG